MRSDETMTGPFVPGTYRKWVVARPMTGNTIRPDQFEMRELAMPELEDGQALVRVRLINLHSRTRLSMPAAGNPEKPGTIPLGETDRSNYGCAEVVASRDKTYKVGDIIHCQLGWQDYQVVSSRDGPIGYAPPTPLVRALNRTNAPMNYVVRPELAASWPSDVLMHVFGTSGMTAYFGLRECGPVMTRDKVLVAAASGSVGSIAAQLAKARGACVVGLAGGEDRCDWVVRELGIDACIDYRAADLADRLREAFPEGIDFFCDGVGGALTELVVAKMNRDGRLFSYGSSAAFYSPERPSASATGMREAFGVTAAIEAAAKAMNIAIECWIVFDFYHERLAAEDELSRLLHQGRIKALTSVSEGFESLPGAVTEMYRKPHAGKVQVRFEADRPIGG